MAAGGGSGGPVAVFFKRYQLLVSLKKMRKSFEKNNMVSNDSKLPNSARNAIKIFFCGGGKRRRTAGAAVPPPFFFKDTNSWSN